MIKIVALASALTHTREHRVTSMSLGDVVDEFHDHDGLADASSTEGAHFTALGEWANQINHLDPSLENLCLRVLIHQRRSRAMDRVTLRMRHRAAFVGGITGYIKNSAQNALTHWNGNRRAGRLHFQATLETFG